MFVRMKNVKNYNLPTESCFSVLRTKMFSHFGKHPLQYPSSTFFYLNLTKSKDAEGFMPESMSPPEDMDSELWPNWDMEGSGCLPGN